MLALILSGSVFQAFAADTVYDRAPHEFLDLCFVNSSLFAERIFENKQGLNKVLVLAYLWFQGEFAVDVTEGERFDLLEHPLGGSVPAQLLQRVDDLSTRPHGNQLIEGSNEGVTPQHLRHQTLHIQPETSTTYSTFHQGVTPPINVILHLRVMLLLPTWIKR